MLRTILALFLNTFLILSIAQANDPMEAYRKMLDNPHVPEAQKVKIREAMKKYQSFNKQMESKTSFKNSKEWYGHFKYTWKLKKGEMQTLMKKEKAKYRAKYESNYKVSEEAKFKINKDFRRELMATKKFPESVRKTNNFDNPANPFPWTVEKMFINHIHGKQIEARRKSAKTDQEKAQAQIMEKMGKMTQSSHAMSSSDINYLIKEVKRFYSENEKRYIKFLNANRVEKKKAISNFVNFAKGINFKTRPKDGSKFSVNHERDYLAALGELKSISFSEPLINKNFKVSDQADLRTFKLKANAQLKELNKLINLVIKSMDLNYLNENAKEVSSSLQKFKSQSVAYRSRDAISKLDLHNGTLEKDRKLSKEKIKKWTENFVKKANNKKLKVHNLYSRAQYWYGNLSAIN